MIDPDILERAEMKYAVGEIKRAKDLGYKWSGKVIYHACSSCGKERWVFLQKGGLPRNLECRSCSCKRKNWRGGGWKNSSGYIMIHIKPNDFFYLMANKIEYVLEHRLVMAKHLGRCLHSWEIVHHKNGIRDDNRIENLQLVSDVGHKQITILENRIALLEKRVLQLEIENIGLRQLKG